MTVAQPTELQQLRNQIDVLTDAVKLMSKVTGSRLSRTQMCERLGISGKTLTDRIRRKLVPEPCSDGKWLLSEVIEWESSQATGYV